MNLQTLALLSTVVLAVPPAASAQQQPEAASADGLKSQADSLRQFMPREYEQLPVPELAAEVATANAIAAAPPVMVVSGGISLGAYQAGFISTLVRFWARNAPDAAPPVWTGASAGAVNALLGGLASCERGFAADSWDPKTSLFWKVWINQLDLESLLPKDPKDKGSDHLFSDDHMRQTLALIEAEIQKGPEFFRGDCSFAFGATVTNLEGRQVPFGQGGKERPGHLHRVTERIVLQVRTSPEGRLTARLPFVTGPADGSPYIEAKRDELVYYPALGSKDQRPQDGREIDLGQLILVPRGSGAFPLAFPPVPADRSALGEEQVPFPLWFFGAEPPNQIEKLRVADGGFLNNNPLDLAQRLANRWRPAQSAAVPAAYRFIYLDQDLVDWEWKKSKKESAGSPIERTYLKGVPALMSAAQDSVILGALEEDSTLSRRISIPRRSSVLPSEFRFAMLGFFDRRFREHDFYRGMIDAVRFIEKQLPATAGVKRALPTLGEMADSQSARQAIWEKLGVHSPELDCMLRDQCRAEDTQLANLRRAMDALTADANSKDETRLLEEDDLDRLLVALGREKYVYSKGVFNQEEAGPFASTGTRQDLMQPRYRIGVAFHDLFNQQSGLLRLARPLGASFLDKWLTYTPPAFAVVFQLSRARGISAGAEWPVLAYETRGLPDDGYRRGEVRVGASVSSLGVLDSEQVDLQNLRMRIGTVDGYVDYVSDLDFMGPYLRARGGLGASGSYLLGPNELVVQPELRLGVELAELVGLRLTIPIWVGRAPEGQGLSWKTPKYFRDSGFGLALHSTWW